MENRERAEQSCLLLHDLTATERQMEDLCRALEGRGYPVGVPNLHGYAPKGEYDRTPMWQRWLEIAQEAYVQLRRISEGVTVIGAGYGGSIATVLAEQYSADGLVVLGSVARPVALAGRLRRWIPFLPLEGADKGISALDAGRLIRLADNNLFSILAPVLVIQAMGDPAFSPRGGEALLAGVRSKRKQALEVEGATVRDMCADYAVEIRGAVLDFLSGKE